MVHLGGEAKEKEKEYPLSNLFHHRQKQMQRTKKL
jgi:hypothetical protein